MGKEVKNPVDMTEGTGVLNGALRMARTQAPLNIEMLESGNGMDDQRAGAGPAIQTQTPTPITGLMTLFSESDKSFESNGNIKIGTSQDIFRNLGYTLPFSGSGVNSYITSIVSKQFIKNFEPTFLQIPYIYSASDNLVNGNYKSLETKEGNKIITIYNIPYKGLNGKDELSTLVTYYDITTNILFYEVPSEFSYNSLTKLSVAASKISEYEYSFKVLIPEDWINSQTVIDEKNKLELSGTLTEN
jgi:hypothetical protein